MGEEQWVSGERPRQDQCGCSKGLRGSSVAREPSSSSAVSVRHFAACGRRSATGLVWRRCADGVGGGRSPSRGARFRLKLRLAGVILLTEPGHGHPHRQAWASPPWQPSAGPPTSCSPSTSATASPPSPDCPSPVPSPPSPSQPLASPKATGHIPPSVLLCAAGLALLLPVLPFALELLALRRMTTAAFATLMALDPAIGAVLGLLVLAPETSSRVHRWHHPRCVRRSCSSTPRSPSCRSG